MLWRTFGSLMNMHSGLIKARRPAIKLCDEWGCPLPPLRAVWEDFLHGYKQCLALTDMPLNLLQAGQERIVITNSRRPQGKCRTL